jgi:hypothetical protein
VHAWSKASTFVLEGLPVPAIALRAAQSPSAHPKAQMTQACTLLSTWLFALKPIF